MTYLIPITWAFAALPVFTQDAADARLYEQPVCGPVPSVSLPPAEQTPAAGYFVSSWRPLSPATFQQELSVKGAGFVDLQGCPVDDQMCEQIARIDSLEELMLVGTWITDDGLTPLSRLKRLSVLDLRGTRVSDDAIPELIRFPGLRVLDVRGTQVTVDGVARLRAERPGLVILSASVSRGE